MLEPSPPRPQDVTDDRFRSGEFFDARDQLQVKYEMLRRVESDGYSVTHAAAAFGFSRPSFYQAQSAFQQGGLPGLVPRKRGPRQAHKLTAEVIEFLRQERQRDPPYGPGTGAPGAAALPGSDSSPQYRTRSGAQSKKTAGAEVIRQPMATDLAARYEQLRSDAPSYSGRDYPARGLAPQSPGHASTLLTLAQEVVNRTEQLWNIAAGDQPYALQIQIGVIVNQHVAQPGDLPPRQLDCVPQLGRDSLRGLADDLQVPHHGVLVDRIGEEHLPARLDTTAYPPTPLPDVVQVQ